MNIQKKAFTLVELIVVIIILAILWTIAFISLQWYSKDARDSTRISTISKIKTSLELFQLWSWKYPLPTDTNQITYSWNLAWSQWYFWEDTFKNVTNLDKIPTDPLTDYQYIYSVTNTRQEYQVAWIIEWGVALNPIYQATAWDKTSVLKISWNYNWKVLKVSTGWVDYILAVPSIITSSWFTIEEIADSWTFAYNWYKNLPVEYDWSQYNVLWDIWLNLVNKSNLLLFSWSIWDLKLTTQESIDARKLFIDKLQLAYSWTQLDYLWDINEILSVTNEDDKEKISTYLINNVLWWRMSAWWGAEWTWEGDLELSISCNDFMKVLGGTWIDFINSSIIDDSWNIYVAWYYYNNSANANWVFDFDGNSLLWMSTTQSNDWFVAKFDSAWNQLWIKTLWWKLEDDVRKVINSNDWWVYVAWIFTNSSSWTNWVKDFAWNALYWKTTNSTLWDTYVAKLDSNWNQLWIKTLWWTWFDQINSLTSDLSWNVYIWWDYVNNTSNSSTVTDFAWNTLYWKYNLIGSDVFVTKLNSSWTKQWIKTLWGGGSQYVYSLWLDLDWNIYAWGAYSNAQSNVNVVVDFLGNTIYWKSTSLSYDWYIIKLDNSWNQQWIKTFWWKGYDNVSSISINNSWNIFIWGTLWNDKINTGLTSDFLWNVLMWKSSVNYNDWLVVKMDTSWNQLWTKVYWWTWDERVSDVKSDNDWNVYVVSNYYNDIDNTKLVYDFADNILLWKPWNLSTTTDSLLSKIDSEWNQLLIKTLWWKSVDSLNTILIDNSWKIYVWWSISNNIDDSNDVTCFDWETTISWKSSTDSYDAFFIVVWE